MKGRQLLLGEAAKVKDLAERLSQCPEVARLDEGAHKEAWALSHAFADLEDSFSRFLDEDLPRLTEGAVEASKINGLLLEIGEEFRHITYHLEDPRFYRYLQADGAGYAKRPQ